jgi:hypothetical protein
MSGKNRIKVYSIRDTIESTTWGGCRTTRRVCFTPKLGQSEVPSELSEKGHKQTKAFIVSTPQLLLYSPERLFGLSGRVRRRAPSRFTNSHHLDCPQAPSGSVA